MSDYLSEEEQVARMKSWWDEYGTSVIVGLVIAVAGIVGWRWYDGYSSGQVAAASAQYQLYQEAQNDDTKAQIAEQMAAEFPGSAYHSLVLFDQAKAAIANADLETAETLLTTVVEQADDKLLLDLARLRLAKVQHALDRSQAALATLAAVRSKGYLAWALETKGDIHMSADEIEQAHQAYQAATAELESGDDRPLLKMKLANTAPFDGEFVQLQDSLEDALREAERVLSTVDSNVEEPADSPADAGSSAAGDDAAANNVNSEDDVPAEDGTDVAAEPAS